jgi:hypothetical protein
MQSPANVPWHARLVCWGLRRPRTAPLADRLHEGLYEGGYATRYICWCDYLPDRVWDAWVHVPGAWRLYRWCDASQPHVGADR